jgi:hypothetical protein
MTKETRMTNARMTKKKTLDYTPSGGRPRFDIRTSSFFRHSTFVIYGGCRKIAIGDLEVARESKISRSLFLGNVL